MFAGNQTEKTVSREVESKVIRDTLVLGCIKGSGLSEVILHKDTSEILACMVANKIGRCEQVTILTKLFQKSAKWTLACQSTRKSEKWK